MARSLTPRHDYRPPLCYICNKRRATSEFEMTCLPCRQWLAENGGRLPGPIIQPGYDPKEEKPLADNKPLPLDG